MFHKRYFLIVAGHDMSVGFLAKTGGEYPTTFFVDDVAPKK